MDIPQRDLKQRAQLHRDGRHVLEDPERFFDGHLEHIGNRKTFELDLERFAVVALALTHFARHVYVRQELHLDLQDAVALACLAAATLDVEREPPWLIPTY